MKNFSKLIQNKLFDADLLITDERAEILRTETTVEEAIQLNELIEKDV